MQYKYVVAGLDLRSSVFLEKLYLYIRAIAIKAQSALDKVKIVTKPVRKMQTIPKTKRELAATIDMSYSSLKRRLDAVGLKIPRGKLSTTHVLLIYEKLGYPDKVKAIKDLLNWA